MKFAGLMLLLVWRLTTGSMAEGAKMLQVNTDWEPGNRIHFSVVNMTSEEIRIYSSELPWGDPSRLVFGVIDMQSRSMPRVFPILNPAAELLILAPGSKLSGRVDAELLVPGLRIGTERVLIVWAWFPKDAEGRKLGAYSGVVLREDAPKP